MLSFLRCTQRSFNHLRPVSAGLQIPTGVRHLNADPLTVSELWDRTMQERERERVKEHQRNERRNTPSSKLRGLPRDTEDVRTSKTISWILRHGAKTEGLEMRPDGYVRVQDLLKLPRMAHVDIFMLEKIVQEDPKMRYHLLFEPSGSAVKDVWWIRANQGHSMKSVEVETTPITDSGQVPMAVHGTSLKAWNIIAKEGLHRMTRNHIHLAQGVANANVVSGMRNSSQVLIFIDLEKAMKAGIKFSLSDNGVVLSEGDENGFIKPEFFKRVERANRQPIPGWEGSATPPRSPPPRSRSATPPAQNAGRADSPKPGETVSKEEHTI